MRGSWACLVLCPTPPAPPTPFPLRSLPLSPPPPPPACPRLQWAARVGGGGMERTLSSSIGDICFRKERVGGEVNAEVGVAEPAARPPQPSPATFGLGADGGGGGGGRAQPAGPTYYHTHEISRGGGARPAPFRPQAPAPFLAM